MFIQSYLVFNNVLKMLVQKHYLEIFLKSFSWALI